MSTVTDATFDDVVLVARVPVVVDYRATWCASCQQVPPVLEQLSQEYDGRVLTAEVDADANPVAVQQDGVECIATLTFDDRGTVVHTLIGARPRARIADAIEQVLADAAEETP